MRVLYIFAALLLASAGAFAQTQKITVTIAGTGMAGYTGDGGSARLAQVSGPKDITLDANENLFFVDRGNGMIRKVMKASNIISTVAGGGTSLVDGIPATAASISPNYLAINSLGDIYFTTWNAVKKVDGATGILTTVAGGMTAGFAGDGGPASAALLMNPQGITVDALDNVYVVDRGNDRVRKITVATNVITTIAGVGIGYVSAGDGGPATAAQLWGPVCVAVDPALNVYFSDNNPNYPGYDNSRIRMISGATGIITTIAGNVPGPTHDCPATASTLGTTTGLYFHRHSGDLYCNEMSCSCRRWHHGHGHGDDSLMLVGGDFGIQSFSDDIMSNLGNMNIPYGLCVDDAGSVYVADSNNQRIRKIVPLSNTPMFAFGRYQCINPTPGVPWPVDSLLWVADIDSGQAETWSIVTPPAYGSVSGFPATVASNGVYRTTHPSGLSYTSTSAHIAPDMFKVRVQDGSGLSDTVTIYIGYNVVALGNSAISKTNASVNIYPNPASSTLNIAWTDLPAGTSALEITDISDKMMYHTVLNSNTGNGAAQVDVSSFPAGMYIVRLNGAEVKKFVKQ